LVFLLAIAVTTLNGCEKEPLTLNQVDVVYAGIATSIPCSIDNMKAAYTALAENPTATKLPVKEKQPSQKSGLSELIATHYYYRFLPLSEEEYELLANDEILEVSDTPFELDLEDGGQNYVDPDLPSGSEFTYFYSVVPVDYSLPEGIIAEKLADLYFTAEDEISDQPSATENELLDFYYELNTTALQISQQLPLAEAETFTYFDYAADSSIRTMSYEEVISNGIPLDDVLIDFTEVDNDEKRRSWTPSGTVTVEEDALSSIGSPNATVPVRNAMIKVRKWGWKVIKKGETDRDGNFSTGSTKVKRVRYAVHFQPHQDKRFKVKAGTVFYDARHQGKIKYNREAWQQHFHAGAYRSHFYALVHNAAADFTFDWTKASEYGLEPVKKGIRISAKFNATGSNWTGLLNHPQTFISPITAIFNTLFLSEVRIARLRNDDDPMYRGSDGIYSVTIHELVHASHYKLDKDMWGLFGLFNMKERRLIVESWAEGVETIVTNDRYRAIDANYFNFSVYNIGWNARRQIQSPIASDASGRRMSEYTPLFIDLNDTLNQRFLDSTLRACLKI